MIAARGSRFIIDEARIDEGDAGKRSGTASRKIPQPDE
jgi:hypothetical protein